jgi:hypothetical protein
MPADYILRTSDNIKINISPPAVVPPLIPPIPLMGSSANFKVMDMPVCLEGDELPKALLAPMPYISPPYVIPGVGTISVTITPSNKTATTDNGKKILIKGGTFQAKFQVSSPAMMPTPAGPQPDPVSVKPGTAIFITTNATTEAG